jgi:hypothetical protein
MGRTRLLRECAHVAVAEGWATLWVRPEIGVDPLPDLIRAVRATLGILRVSEPAAMFASAPAADFGETPDAGTSRSERFSAAVRSAVEQGGRPLLLLVDDVEALPLGLQAALRFLVSEAPPSILVMTAGQKSAGLPDADTFEIGGLSSRELRQLLAPLLNEIVNTRSG